MKISGSAFEGGAERRVAMALVIVLGPLRKCVSLHMIIFLFIILIDIFNWTS